MMTRPPIKKCVSQNALCIYRGMIKKQSKMRQNEIKKTKKATKITQKFTQNNNKIYKIQNKIYIWSER